LGRAVERGDERGRTSAEASLAQLLRTSHKESLFSFVFRDEASLQACRQQMLALWDLLLALLEGRVVGFAVRRCCYELLRLLLHREELGCTLFASAEATLPDTQPRHPTPTPSPDTQPRHPAPTPNPDTQPRHPAPTPNPDTQP
jgi:hypothetical protein